MLLGGAGAIASGSAIAGTWRPYLSVPPYMVALAAALRFLNYALFGGDLLSIPGFIIALVVIVRGFGLRLSRLSRVQQMVTQYSLALSSAPDRWDGAAKTLVLNAAARAQHDFT